MRNHDCATNFQTRASGYWFVHVEFDGSETCQEFRIVVPLELVNSTWTDDSVHPETEEPFKRELWPQFSIPLTSRQSRPVNPN